MQGQARLHSKQLSLAESYDFVRLLQVWAGFDRGWQDFKETTFVLDRVTVSIKGNGMRCDRRRSLGSAGGCAMPQQCGQDKRY